MGLNGRWPRRDLLLQGFTLVELIVALAVLLLIMALVFSITDQTSKLWKNSSAQIQAFQNARAAYDNLTMRLRQATLNTYLDYYDNENPPAPRTPTNASNFAPYYYARNSDLHFVVDRASNIFIGTPTLHPTHAVFFQAPLGYTLTSSSLGPLQNLMNACGYYVEFNSDQSTFPPFLTSTTTVHPRYRYRLMEFLQPTESNTIYSVSYTGNTPAAQYDQWFTNFLPTSAAEVSSPPAKVPSRILAENIIALIISPEVTPSDQSIAPNYTYDSRAGTIASAQHHQLPPLLRVVMVAIDEPSAAQLNSGGNTAPPAFLTTLLTGNAALFQTPYNPPYNAASPVSNPPPNNLDADLATLSLALTANHVNYRIFDTDISIRGAEWSIQ